MFSKEPAVIIAGIAAVVIAALQTLAGSGIIVSSTGQSIVNVLLVIIPLIAGLITRSIVTAPANLPAPPAS